MSKEIGTPQVVQHSGESAATIGDKSEGSMLGGLTKLTIGEEGDRAEHLAGYPEAVPMVLQWEWERGQSVHQLQLPLMALQLWDGSGGGEEGEQAS